MRDDDDEVMPSDAYIKWPCQVCHGPVGTRPAVFLSFRMPEGMDPDVADYVFCAPRCLITFILAAASEALDRPEDEPRSMPKPPRGWRTRTKPPSVG